MRFLLLLCFVFVSIVLPAQTIPQHPNKTENGLRQGNWAIWYDKDWNETKNKDSVAFYRLIEYKDDIPVGLTSDYYSNGKLQMQGKLLAEKPKEIWDGKVTYYFPSGNKEKEEYYEKGKLQADALLFKEDGTIDSIALADYFYNNSFYERAEPLLLHNKKSIEKTVGKWNRDYALACTKLGFLYRTIVLFSKAELYYLEAREVYERISGKESIEYARANGNLGELYYTQGYYSKAEPLQVNSKNTFEKIHGKFSSPYANACVNMGNLFARLGRFTEAENLLIEAKEIQEKIASKNSYGYARACSNLAVLYSTYKFYLKALPLYEEAKAIRQMLEPYSLEYINTCMSLGITYMYLQRYDDAEKLLIEALNLTKQVVGEKHLTFAIACNNLSAFYNNCKLYKKAELLQIDANKVIEQVLGTQHFSYANGCNNLAEIYINQKKYDKAESFLLKAYQTYYSIIENQLSYMSEREKEAFLNTFKQEFEAFNSFVLLRQKDNPAVVGNMYNNLLATKALLFNTQNAMRKHIIGSGKMELIALLNDWQEKRENLAKAFKMSISEREKRKINLQESEKEINLIEKQLSQQTAVFSRSRTNSVTWQDVQKTIKPKQAAIEMVRFRYHNKKFTDTIYYAALIITPTSKQPELVVLNNGNELEKAIKYYKNNIKFEIEDKTSYNLFWRSISERLNKVAPKTKKIYFSADGVYHALNLQTLLNPQSGKYVADEYEIQLLTNTKDLIGAIQKIDSRNEAFLFGYPDYTNTINENNIPDSNILNYDLDSLKREFVRGRISMLPGTEKEVKGLFNTLAKQNWKTETFILGQATESKLKDLRSPKVLHIATHGFFMQDVNVKDNSKGFIGIDNQKIFENPLLRSGLLLAGSQQSLDGKNNFDEEDGILTAYEAMNLDLSNTDLVVLSACETGLGEIKNGEGVFGLQRAFQTAGAKSIIMSLWKVNDTSTQELMQLFYNNWLSSGDKRKAFIQAQDSMRRKYKHPFFWGAFVLVGE
ncbi:MAG: CHAT domain-containing protein [Cyclobacteriaceae bacterium]|nr:CHAT domain-containing protein [Cyclobacteriaceae bacterium]